MAKTRSGAPVPGNKPQSDAGRVPGQVIGVFTPFKEWTVAAADVAPYKSAFSRDHSSGVQGGGSIENLPVGSFAWTSIPVEPSIASMAGPLLSHDAACKAVGEAAAAIVRSAHAVAVASGQAVRIVFTLTPGGDIKPVEIVSLSPLQDDFNRGVNAPDRLGSALARARRRGERRAAEILDGPEMLNSDAMAARLGTSRETINRMRQRGELLGLEGARRGVRYPEWQLLPPGQLPLREMPELFRILGEPWAVYRFLLQVHPELDGARALDAIRDGDSAAVIELAGTIATSTVS